MFISLEPFVLALDSNTVDLSILSMTSAKGMRSLFRFRIEKELILLHLLWHFNWLWGETTKSNNTATCPTCAREGGIHWPTCPNDSASKELHIIQIKQQLPEAVKTDDIPGRMKSNRVRRNSDTAPISPTKRKRGSKNGNSSAIPN